MKKILLLLLICTSINTYSQTEPFTDVILTANKISGNTAKENTVIAEVTNGATTSEIIITVNYKGYFEHTFNPALIVSQINIYAIDEEKNKIASLKNPIKVETSETILNKISQGKIKLPSNTLPIVAVSENLNPEIDELQPASTTYKYKVSMLNTNFTVPIVRFNLTSDNNSGKDGDILLFNSIGAGVGYSWGLLEKTTDAKGEIINTEFTSTIGFHLGLLFSAGSNSTENKNVFAPTFSFSILDFQFGYGLEMGSRVEFQKRDFWTIAYAIPLSKLIKGKYFVHTSSKGYNSTHPLPLIKDENNNEVNVDKNDKPKVDVNKDGVIDDKDNPKRDTDGDGIIDKDNPQPDKKPLDKYKIDNKRTYKNIFI